MNNTNPNFNALTEGTPKLKELTLAERESGLSFKGYELKTDQVIDGEIPYVKAVYGFMGDRFASHDRVIIFSDEPGIARNAAALLATQRYDSEPDPDDDLYDDYDDYEDDPDYDVEEYFDVEALEEMGLENPENCNPRNVFREVDLGKAFEPMTIIGNQFHTLLMTMLYPAHNILIKGLEAPDGREDKLEAVENIMNTIVSRTMILVPKSEKDSVWIKDIMRKYHFSALELPDCMDYLKKLAEKPGVEIDREFAERSFHQARVDTGSNIDEETVAKYMTDPRLRFKENKPAMDKLNEMIGMEEVKEAALEFVAMMAEKEVNPELGNLRKSMIFLGNPGTGKTTAAELMAEILAETGNSKRQIVTVTRDELIGKYVGHTAPKVRKKFNEARGGVMFVDEAGFFLGRGNDTDRFAAEAIKEFVRYMELYDDVTVIFAMYKNEVEDFLSLDEGLASRISRHVVFDDYSNDELVHIAHYMSEKKGYSLDTKAEGVITDYVDRLREREQNKFGNAREIRKLVEATIMKHAVRRYLGTTNGGTANSKNAAKKTSTKKAQAFAETLSVEDMQDAIKTLEKNADNPKRSIGFVLPAAHAEEG